MRNKLLSLPLCGGANDDFGDNGWNPRNKNVRTKFGRSLRSLRMHKTTASTSNFSSANSSNVMNDCFDASGNKTVGKATYKSYFRDLKRYPKHWMLFRWRAISMWCELASFDAKYASQFRRSHPRTLKQLDRHSFQNQQRLEMEQQLRHRFRKNQYRKIVMNLLNLVMFCDLNHLVEMPYRDLFCGCSWHQKHHRGPTPREIQ